MDFSSTPISTQRKPLKHLANPSITSVAASINFNWLDKGKKLTRQKNKMLGNIQ
jgi:hypothetical protein